MPITYLKILAVALMISSSTLAQPDCGCTPTLFKVELQEGGKCEIQGKIDRPFGWCHDKTKTYGFPMLDCSVFDGTCTHTPNRYIAVNQNSQYLVIDSLGKVIVAESDTIIGFTDDQRGVPHDVDCPDVDHRGGYQIYYQAVRNDHTHFYNIDGVLRFKTTFQGTFIDESYSVMDNPYHVVRGYDFDCLGLIDSLGNQILKPHYDYVAKYAGSTRHLYVAIDIHQPRWRGTDVEQIQTFYLIDASTGETLVKSQDLQYYLNYGLMIYEKDGKYAIYHPDYGLLTRHKYDSIRHHRDGIELKNLVVTKRGKSKEWKTPQKVINHWESVFPEEN